MLHSLLLQHLDVRTYRFLDASKDVLGHDRFCNQAGH